MKSWLEKNAIEIYLAHNEGKFFSCRKSITTYKILKIYKYNTSVSKNFYIDKLDDIVNKYNNIYHSSIKMKPVDVKSNKILTLVRKLMILVILLEYRNINLVEEAFVIKKV